MKGNKIKFWNDIADEIKDLYSCTWCYSTKHDICISKVKWQSFFGIIWHGRVVSFIEHQLSLLIICQKLWNRKYGDTNFILNKKKQIYNLSASGVSSQDSTFKYVYAYIIQNIIGLKHVYSTNKSRCFKASCLYHSFATLVLL